LDDDVENSMSDNDDDDSHVQHQDDHFVVNHMSDNDDDDNHVQ
jgi:hypothetical protein